MTAHFLILLLLGNLILGAWIFMTVKGFAGNRRDAAAAELSRYILFYNLFITFLFISRYVNLNLGTDNPLQRIPYSPHVLYLLSSLPFFGMFIEMLKLYGHLRGKTINRGSIRTVVLIFILFWIVYLLNARQREAGGTNAFLFFFYNWIVDNDILLEAALLIVMLARAGNKESAEKKKIIRIFALFMLSRYILLVAFLPFNRTLRPVLLALTLIWANLCPLIWIWGWYDRYLSRREGLQDTHVAAFAAGAGLSGREREILYHVMQGRGNRDIMKLLGISYHTVKHHLTSMYRKCSCRNRMDLVQRCRQGHNREEKTHA